MALGLAQHGRHRLRRAVRLAAPQVGVSKRVFVYGCGGREGHLINPVWRAVGDEMQTAAEGCLSIPEVRGDCTRHMHVVAEGVDVTGAPVTIEATEILARCIQHETDHLDGVMFMRRMEPEQRKEAMAAIRAADWR